MKNKLLNQKIVVFVFVNIFCITAEKVIAQNYFTMDELYDLSTKKYENEVEEFVKNKGYYLDNLEVEYEDKYGNSVMFSSDNGTNYVDYTIKVTPAAINFFQVELNDSDNYCYRVYPHQENSPHGILYESPNAMFALNLKKGDSAWTFSIHQRKKGEISFAHRYAPNKLEINSYTNFTNVIVHKGDNVYLKANGNIVVGLFAGSTSPDGIDGLQLYSCNRSFPHGSLLGKIGTNGNWFLIGSYKEFTATEEGELQVMVNDCDPTNNSGRFYLEYGINKSINTN